MLLLTELGTRLKEARLSKGYSLDDLQDITKIQKRYLVGIEEGNYSIMPGSFYVRAFIKQYAEAVGLDADEILEEFKKELPNQPTEEVAQSISQSPTRRKLNTRSTNRLLETMPKIIVALFIVVIILAIWFLNQQKVSNTPDDLEDDVSEVEYDKSPTPVKPVEDEATTDEEDTEAPVEEDVEEEPVVTQTITAGEVSGETTNYTLSGTDTMNIRIEVSGETWVGIRNANGQEQVDDRVYNAGEVVNHDSTTNAYARIRLGNSKNAKVFVNDEQVQLVQDITTQNIIITLQQEQ
ncbi:helix-turn-helix domain-containing protein [Ureibacillus xyleni]|uniref:helix-turn-helix domain-containing protein n=1 Tax=Ureibacillus xyleni TaxID=614648 RepID=UPI001F337C16|nr:RodZ family helix-turn-helix domain-containing protein [Ureibacillus xyleni]